MDWLNTGGDSNNNLPKRLPISPVTHQGATKLVNESLNRTFTKTLTPTIRVSINWVNFLIQL